MLLLCLFSGFIAAFALRKLQKHGKQGNFHVFGKKLHKKQADFLCVLTVGLSRAAHIHYIYKNVPRVRRLPRPALAIKNFQRFPLCYYYIASMRFCQAFPELIEKYEYDGLHKYQTFHTFQTFQTTQPPGFSAVVPIFQRQKVDHRRLYCASEKLKPPLYLYCITGKLMMAAFSSRRRIDYIHYIYSIFPAA